MGVPDASTATSHSPLVMDATPVTVMAWLPIGVVAPLVARVSVLLLPVGLAGVVGLLVNEETLAPVGSPETDRLTNFVEPASKRAIISVEPDAPLTTLIFPALSSE